MNVDVREMDPSEITEEMVEMYRKSKLEDGDADTAGLAQLALDGDCEAARAIVAAMRADGLLDVVV